MKETDALDEYILQHIDEESDYLKALYRDTHVKLLRPRMASGHLQGRMLKMFVRMIRPQQVLEIGTYSGYSALCLAEGLTDGSMLHTFEINDEQEDFTRPWLENSPYADKIKFYIGDAWQSIFQFRGADGAVFTKLEDFDLYKLDYNYRSYQEIIDYAATVYLKLRHDVDDRDCYISEVMYSQPSGITCARGNGGQVAVINPFGRVFTSDA